ncbi:MAG TPA: hypothetical protein VGM76_05845 [Lacipirellulaceae bacterium]|jgi:hypothetical protein
MATASDFLASYIEPLAEELTPQQAEKILATRPSTALVDRVRELGDKANAGTLNEQERAEYEHYVDVDDVIGLLKAKARTLLGRSAN